MSLSVEGGGGGGRKKNKKVCSHTGALLLPYSETVLNGCNYGPSPLTSNAAGLLHLQAVDFHS